MQLVMVKYLSLLPMALFRLIHAPLFGAISHSHQLGGCVCAFSFFGKGGGEEGVAEF